jgi:homoserine kinase
MRSATAFAPASVGNVAVGFDLLGHALVGAGDRVTVTVADHGTVKITAITFAGIDPIALPAEAARNTAGRALLDLLSHLHENGLEAADLGFDIAIEKGIALGSGMGGSAASAVAAVVAANALLTTALPIDALYRYAVGGEALASGAAHGDNVAPMLLGGLTIAPAISEGIITPVRVPVPKWLHVALVHPHFVLETKTARAALAGDYPLSAFVHQSENLALVLAGLYTNDAGLLRRGLRDGLIEPRRAPLIPGFSAVKQAALDHGALGASISGAGPSVFGWFASEADATRAGAAMATAFADAGLPSDVVISPVAAPGAVVEQRNFTATPGAR